MKKVFKPLIVLTACGALIFNINKSISAPQSTKLELSNIALLQASAGEAKCDATTTATCKIGIATGTGVLINVN